MAGLLVLRQARRVKLLKRATLVACVVLFASAVILSWNMKRHDVARRELYNRKQKMVFEETQRWRDFEDVCYAGYCGPWIEEVFMTHFEDTTGGRESDRIFLPISWTNCNLKCSAAQKESLREFVMSLDPEFKYFSVIQIANGIHHPGLQVSVPEDVDVLFFSAGGISSGAKVSNVVIPLLKDQPEVIGLQKKYWASFVGTERTHAVRGELYQIFNDSFLFGKSSSWKLIMEKSYFSLCPRGFGPSSFRLFESIWLESIPVYVWEQDLLLPFQNMLSWEDFAVIVHRSNITQIPDILISRDYGRMRENLIKARKYFTFDFTCTYILDVLAQQT